MKSRAHALSPGLAFYLATHGGARALGKAKFIGTLAAGKEAGLTLVDLAGVSPCDQNATPKLPAEDVAALCIYRGGPANTVATYVRGRSVYERNRATRS